LLFFILKIIIAYSASLQIYDYFLISKIFFSKSVLYSKELCIFVFSNNIVL